MFRLFIIIFENMNKDMKYANKYINEIIFNVLYDKLQNMNQCEEMSRKIVSHIDVN
jgi:hypothetical protein